jgi:adenylosuccinate synthase
MKQADALVGLQWGSEGKGKIAGVLSGYYRAAVRTGAPNAGHTVEYGGTKFVMRSIPCAFGNPDVKLYVGPAGLVNLEVLENELEQFPDRESILGRLRFDRNAVVVRHSDIEDEERFGMNSKNGSTAEGVGPAQARKVLRRDCETVGMLENSVELFKGRVVDVALELHELMQNGGAVMLEGTQGFGLSMNHGDYPFVTSRDILASSLLSDAGIAPRACRYVFGVMRTYPIRVAGNSGPMGGGRELTWEEVSRRCGAPDGAIVEKTTVTKRVRRVSEIDWAFMRRSVALNGPDGVFINFIDYIDWSMHGKKAVGDITPNGWAFIEKVERELKTRVLGVSTGAMAEDMIYLPEWERFKSVLSQQALAFR